MGTNCTCDFNCPGAPHCACILVHDEDACICECTAVPAAPRQEKLGLEAPVSFSAKTLELGSLAVFLSKICEAELLVPARSLNDEITMELPDTSLRSVIEKVGLVVGEPGGE
ncbi:MAG: hypothetical protein M3164_02175 [Actinomycetota bacterium]|nr:hypothetical protein [Actinomycetota bacterium]